MRWFLLFRSLYDISGSSLHDMFSLVRQKALESGLLDLFISMDVEDKICTCSIGMKEK